MFHGENHLEIEKANVVKAVDLSTVITQEVSFSRI
jgi:hypothetical protein